MTRIEVPEIWDRVAVSIEEPDFPGTDMYAAKGRRSLLFTFMKGKVVRTKAPACDPAFQLTAR